MTGGHDKNLIKHYHFDVPAGNRRAKRWSARTPRRAAQGICDFWELQALARFFSLRGLSDSSWWTHGGPAGMCRNAIHDIGKIT